MEISHSLHTAAICEVMLYDVAKISGLRSVAGFKLDDLVKLKRKNISAGSNGQKTRGSTVLIKPETPVTVYTAGGAAGNNRSLCSTEMLWSHGRLLTCASIKRNEGRRGGLH